MIDWLELLWRAAEEGQTKLPADSAEFVKEAPSYRIEQEDIRNLSGDLEDSGDVMAALTTLRIPFEGAVFPLTEQGPLPSHAMKERVRSTARPQSRVEMLYRTVREAVGPLVTANSLRERKIVEEEAPRPTGLTEGMLDRAMRRDSRRYDSGMTIY